MLDFFAAIGDAIGALVSFVGNMVTNLGNVIALIPQAMTIVTNSIGYMPGMLSVFAVTGISICVVFFIIDR